MDEIRNRVDFFFSFVLNIEVTNMEAFFLNIQCDTFSFHMRCLLSQDLCLLSQDRCLLSQNLLPSFSRGLLSQNQALFYLLRTCPLSNVSASVREIIP